MAMHPNPDRNTKYMQETWGTTRLITDYVPQKEGTPSKSRKNDPPENRMSKMCGGKEGFDDYVEWWV